MTDENKHCFSELVSPNIQIYSSNKVARDFVASIASAYRLSTRRTIKLDQKHEKPGIDHLLKQKRKRRKLWQETRDPKCKTAVNWVTENIRRMVRKRST
jgi:hypothetical protein